MIMRYSPHRHSESDVSDCLDPNCPLNRRIARHPLYRHLFRRAATVPAEAPRIEKGKNPPDRRDVLHSRLRKVPCVYQGEPTGEDRQCNECGGRHKRIPVLLCNKHGECSVDGSVDKAVHCLRCSDYYPIGFDRLGVSEKKEEPTSQDLPTVSVPVAESKPDPISPKSKGPEPAVSSSQRVVRASRRNPLTWSYGVTTVPSRMGGLLPRTLESLSRAGFDQPRLFVDGCDAELERQYRGRFKLQLTSRNPAVRTFGNWVLALWELYVREPLSDRYAIFQDDMITVRNLRGYLESMDYPKNGYLNLYTFPENEKVAEKREVRTGFFESNQRGRGAVALVFSREAVQVLLSARHLADRPTDPQRGWRAIDGGIVSSFNKAGWREFCHTPSLVQHIGDKSSMGNRQHPEAPTFPGEDFDALDLLR